MDNMSRVAACILVCLTGVVGCSRSNNAEVEKAKVEAAAARAEADAAKAEVAKLKAALAPAEVAKPAPTSQKGDIKAAEEQARTIVKQLGGKSEEDLSLPDRPIVKLNLDGKTVSDEGLAKLSAGTPRLKSLSLRGSPLTAAGLVHVAKLAHLEDLTLGDATVSEQDLAPLAESKSLKRLSCFLEGQKVTGDALKRLKHLEELTIASSGADDNTAQKFATMENLRVLGLEGSQNLTDAGVAHLKALTKLETLNLYNVQKLTDKSLEELKALKNLKRLHIDYSKVTYAGVQDFKASLPNCQVFGAPAKPK